MFFALIINFYTHCICEKEFKFLYEAVWHMQEHVCHFYLTMRMRMTSLQKKTEIWKKKIKRGKAEKSPISERNR